MTPQESRPIRLAEYSALRSEITTLVTLQVQLLYTSYSIALGGALAGTFIKDPSFEVVAIFPLPFLILGLLYLDAVVRTLRVANYIQTELGPTLIDSATGAPILGWESFIRAENQLNPVLSVLQRLRWYLFVVPQLTPIIWLIGNRPQPQHRFLVDFLFTVEFILFFLFLWVGVKLQIYAKSLAEKGK
jgi:hypothetical protein